MGSRLSRLFANTCHTPLLNQLAPGTRLRCFDAELPVQPSGNGAGSGRNDAELNDPTGPFVVTGQRNE
jgi:hypothetical protein